VTATPDDVLRFWFPGDSAALPAPQQLLWWFRGGADLEICARFASLHERAARGELDAWARDPRGRLALILVLDQFSRSIHRNSPKTWAQDPKALGVALEGLACGHYAALAAPWEKTFFFLPLGHSEDMACQQRAVELAEALAAEAAPEARELLAHSASQARGHRDVIARFGRHPHRNALLGRPSTAAEREYLANEQLVHTRPVPETGAGG
jgi:uncharacterized protein (DUF924 family)